MSTASLFDVSGSTAPIAAALVLSLGLGGCSKFIDIEEEVAEGIVEDVPFDADGGQDVPDVTDAGDADGDLDAGEVGDADADGDVPTDGAEDTKEDRIVPTCDDPCSAAEVGETRCKPTAGQTLQTCTFVQAESCHGWVDTPCPEPNLCQGTFSCGIDADSKAACIEDTAQAVQCTGGEPCNPDTCNPATGNCEPDLAPLGVGAFCDDSNPCTKNDICKSPPLHCDGDDDLIKCGCSEDSDCDQFEDEDFCNGTFKCQNSFCTLQPPKQCDPNPDPCLNNVCVPATGSCDPVPGPNGIICDDGNACSTSSQCIDGVCEPLAVKECPAGTCETATCDSVSGACGVEVVPDCCGNGTPEGDEQCDDGNDNPGDDCLNSCDLVGCKKLAVELDGTDCLAAVGGLSGNITNYTVEMFVKPTSTSQDAILLDLRGTGNAGPRLYYTTDGGALPQSTLIWEDTDGTGGTMSHTGPDLLPNQWQHIAVVRDTAAGELRWYFKGTPLTGSTAITTFSAAAAAGDLKVGCGEDASGTAHFEGLLDEVRISSVARYDAPFTVTTGPFTTDADTVALYHFDHPAPGFTPSDTNAPGLVWLGAETTEDALGAGAAVAKAACAPEECVHRALSFDGSQQGAITFADASALDGEQALTVEFYFQFADGAPNAPVVGRTSSVPGDQDWHISLISQGSIRRLRWTEGQFGGNENFTSSPEIPSDTWVHVAVTRTFDPDGATGAETTVRWFVDGVGASGQILQGALPFSFAVPRPLIIGASVNSGGNPSSPYLTAMLDELRITRGVRYNDDFTPPSELKLTWDTALLYHFDETIGDWVWPHRYTLGVAGLLSNSGVSRVDTVSSQLTPCP